MDEDQIDPRQYGRRARVQHEEDANDSKMLFFGSRVRVRLMEYLVEQETADPVPLVGMPADIPVVERQLTRSMTKATPEDMQRLEKDSDDEQEIPELVKDSDDDEELLKASPARRDEG